MATAAGDAVCPAAEGLTICAATCRAVTSELRCEVVFRSTIDRDALFYFHRKDFPDAPRAYLFGPTGPMPARTLLINHRPVVMGDHGDTEVAIPAHAQVVGYYVFDSEPDDAGDHIRLRLFLRRRLIDGALTPDDGVSVDLRDISVIMNNSHP
jgi:hypothetical protein